jgi:hypothetical protein
MLRDGLHSVVALMMSPLPCGAERARAKQQIVQALAELQSQPNFEQQVLDEAERHLRAADLLQGFLISRP